MVESFTGAAAQALIAAGYPTDAAGMVEGIRLDDIEECRFEVRGPYGGNNAIHRLANEDVEQLETASPIPPEEVTEPARRAVHRREPPLATGTTELRVCVDHFEIRSVRDGRAFDSYAMVDWSSSSPPVAGNDSIWIGSGSWSQHTFTADEPLNVSTRREAVDILRRKITNWRRTGRRVLVGFDFAFGYPAGFAAALGLATAGGAWKALHSYIAANVTDTANNFHNRDAFAEACNKTIGAPGPFWGCGKSVANDALTQHRVGKFSYPHYSLEEWRATDREAKKRATTQSVWKLNCGVSVGGQTILGIKHLHELANDVGGHRWPFDGWGAPREPAIWFTEIFPTLVQYPQWSSSYAMSRDRTQVQSCVRFAAERDGEGLLKVDFERPTHRLDASTLERVEDEEGWILWV